MKIKTSELTGKALDWAVSECELAHMRANGMHIKEWVVQEYRVNPPPFSTECIWGGPIMFRERINLQFCRDFKDRNGLYIHADMSTNSYHGYWRGDHDHPLIAAMRCYIASKMGDEVDIPEELCK